MSSLILAWAEENAQHLDRLRELLTHAPLGVTGREQFSFQRLMLPLLTLLTQNGFANSSHEQHKERMYNQARKVAEELFPKLLSCVEQMCASGALVDPSVHAPATSPCGLSYHRPLSIDALIHPVAELLLKLCRQFRDFSAQHMDALTQWSLRLEQMLPPAGSAAAAAAGGGGSRAARSLKLVMEIVANNKEYDDRRRAMVELNMRLKAEALASASGPSSSTHRIASLQVHASLDLPGELNATTCERPCRLPQDQHPARRVGDPQHQRSVPATLAAEAGRR